MMLLDYVGSTEDQMFRWLCPSTFSLRDTNVTFWPPCSPEHVVWQRVIRGASEFKVRKLISGK